MRGRFPALLVLLLAGAAGGCWDYLDIDSRSIVLGWAIDEERRDVEEIAMEVAVPPAAGGGAAAGTPPGRRGGGTTGGGAGGSGRTVLRASAASTPDAIAVLRERWPRPFTFGHLGMIILGESYARSGDREVYGCSGCHPEISTGTHLLAAAGRGGDLLALPPPAESYTSIFYSNLIRNALKRSTVPQTHTVADFVARMERDGVALLPRIAAPGGTPTADGAGVFKRYRLIGWLTPREVLGVNLLRAGGRRGLVEFPCPTYEAGRGGREAPREKTTFLVLSKRNRVAVTETADGPAFRFSVHLTGIALNPGCSAAGVRFSKPEEERFRSEIEKQARTTILNAVRRARALNADFLGLGEALRLRRPALWRSLEPRWDEVFPTLPVSVEVRVLLRRRPAFH